jgi:Flp pilus assembly CpaF family ATPase
MQAAPRRTTMNLYSANPMLEGAVQRLLGQQVADLLSDRTVQEVSANYAVEIGAGYVFADYGEGPMRSAGATVPADAIEAATRILASEANKSLEPEAPFLNRVLAAGFRYHAALPPVSDGPRFSIRTHQRIRRPLSDFMSVEQTRFVREAIRARKNILCRRRHQFRQNHPAGCDDRRDSNRRAADDPRRRA